jgi:hypothetical protein
MNLNEVVEKNFKQFHYQIYSNHDNLIRANGNFKNEYKCIEETNNERF